MGAGCLPCRLVHFSSPSLSFPSSYLSSFSHSGSMNVCGRLMSTIMIVNHSHCHHHGRMLILSSPIFLTISLTISCHLISLINASQINSPSLLVHHHQQQSSSPNGKKDTKRSVGPMYQSSGSLYQEGFKLKETNEGYPFAAKIDSVPHSNRFQNDDDQKLRENVQISQGESIRNLVQAPIQPRRWFKRFFAPVTKNPQEGAEVNDMVIIKHWTDLFKLRFDEIFIVMIHSFRDSVLRTFSAFYGPINYFFPEQHLTHVK